MSEIIQFPRLIDCQTVFISGPVSSGKTYLMRRWAASQERVLVHDVAAAFLSEDYEHIWNDIPALCARLEKNPYYVRIAYHVAGGEIQSEFELEAAAIWQLVKPRWLFVDECQTVFGDSLYAMAENVLRYSRHAMLGVVAASQRIAGIDKLLTGGARMVVLFRTDEVRDLMAIEDRWGREMRDAVSSLRPCIYDDKADVCEQEPQCVVYLKGSGFRVVSLGSKIKTNDNGDEKWEEILEGQQATSKPQSSAPTTGNRGEPLPESTSEATLQDQETTT